MDKIQLKKQITALRSLVKSTRTIFIQKHVRDHKFWSSKVTANSENQRAQKKAESAGAVLQYIRSLGTADLVEEVLKYQPPKNGQSLDSGSVPRRTISRFCANEKLGRHLSVVVSKFSSDDKSAIVTALRQKKTLRPATEKKPGSKKKPKLQKDKKRKNQSKSKPKKKQKLKAEMDEQYEESDSDDQVIERQVADTSEEDESDRESDLSVSFSEDNNNDGDKEIEPTAATQLISASANKDHSPSTTQHNERDVGKFVLAVEDNSKVLKSKVIMKKANNYKPPEEEEEDEGCELITDSFFITNTGKQYVAVAPKRKANADNEEDGEEEIEESWKLANRRKRRSQQWNSGEDENVEDLNSKMAKQPTGWEKSSWNEKKHSSQTEAMEDLHPSWAAKQAQKGIKPFAGKKVIFGNEDDYGDQSVDSVHSKNDLHPSWAAKQAQKGIKPFIGKKIVFNGANNSEQEATSADNTKSNLHPSWAAKQAQQGIKPFAGKKVVFDNEVGNEANSMGDLHPSWAAKQAQKGIKPFAGKKVVFNDEDDSLRDPTTDKRYIHPSWAAKQAQKGIKPFAGKKVIFNEENGSVRDSNTDEPSKCDIHPSWAAKQSQKGIKSFAGKKVVFDNEDSSERVAVNPAKSKSDLHPSWAAKQAQQGIKPFAGKKVVFDATDKTERVSTVARKEAIEYDSKNDVHPSWAAKQAQKGIKQFAGKKVIFDTDNNDNQHTSNYTKKPPVVTDDFVKKPHPAPSDLHPSWAAKQAQNGIKPFAGTKISFDD